MNIWIDYKFHAWYDDDEDVTVQTLHTDKDNPQHMAQGVQLCSHDAVLLWANMAATDKSKLSSREPECIAK